MIHFRQRGMPAPDVAIVVRPGIPYRYGVTVGVLTGGTVGRRRSRSIWFWLLVAVLIILLLGLIFGGYRKGTPVSSPPVSISGV